MEAQQTCPGNHTPSCPTMLLCACKREGSSEEDALAALREEEEKRTLDVNAYGIKEVEHDRGIYRYLFTPLMWAADHGWLRFATALLDRGADVDKADQNGWTPLHISCEGGQLELSRLLLDRGAEVDKEDDEGGATPLLNSCSEGHLDLARLLLDRSAEVDKADNNGDTPLIICCIFGHLKVARLLLAHGAKGNENAKESTKLTREASSQNHTVLGAWLAERVGWPKRKYSCEAGWEAWSPYNHMLWPEHHRQGVVLMLLVESRLRKTGKDVMLHILSFCSWSWFEVSVALGNEAGMLTLEEAEEEGELIGARVKRRKLLQ